MSSPATKNEAEFDDLLGQLVDELAMTPASQSAVALVPEPEPAARVESTKQLAAEAAAAAGVTASAGPSGTTVKVVGIIAGSLTAVAVAALIVFGAGSGPSEPAPMVAQDDSAERAERLSEVAAAHRLAAEQVEQERMAAEQAELDARHVQLEAARLRAELEAATAAKPKPKPRTRTRPRPKSDHGSDFDKL